MGKQETTTADVVAGILVDQLGLLGSEDTVTPEAAIVDDLGADSLDVVEIAMALEEEFGVEVPDEDILAARRVKDVVALVERLKERQR